MNFVRTVLVTGAVIGCWVACMPSSQAGETLYKRLGGYDAIAGFVDTAFPRVAMNPQLTHLFRGHSVESQRRQRQLIVDAICEATGGPCIYIGREMKPVHVGLGITDEQWSTFMTIIGTTAVELKFGEAERRNFLSLASVAVIGGIALVIAEKPS
jgi:hemoglobin